MCFPPVQEDLGSGFCPIPAPPAMNCSGHRMPLLHFFSEGQKKLRQTISMNWTPKFNAPLPFLMHAIANVTAQTDQM